MPNVENLKLGNIDVILGILKLEKHKTSNSVVFSNCKRNQNVGRRGKTDSGFLEVCFRVRERDLSLKY